MKRKWTCLMAAALALVMGLSACGGGSAGSGSSGSSGGSSGGSGSGSAAETKEETVVLKLHHAQGTTHPFDSSKQHPYQVAAEHLAAYVEEKSGGTLKIEIYPAGALGEDEEILEQMQEGIVDMSLVMPTSKAAAVVPELNVFNFPFLFVSAAHGEAFAKTADAQKLLDACSDHDMVGLGFSTFLFRYPVNSKHECVKVADFNGLRMRTMDSPAALAAYAALGCNTVSMSFGELFSALQLGTIDGVENDLLTLLSQNYHEVAPYLSLVPVWPFASVTLVSRQTWDKLSDNQRQILTDGVAEAIDVVNSEYAASLEGALDILREKGAIISEPADMQEFVSAMQPVYDTYLAELSPELQEIVQNIINMGADY